mgnify:CR=1 FL=1
MAMHGLGRWDGTWAGGGGIKTSWRASVCRCRALVCIVRPARNFLGDGLESVSASFSTQQRICEDGHLTSISTLSHMREAREWMHPQLIFTKQRGTPQASLFGGNVARRGGPLKTWQSWLATCTEERPLP